MSMLQHLNKHLSSKNDVFIYNYATNTETLAQLNSLNNTQAPSKCETHKLRFPVKMIIFPHQTNLFT